MGPTFAKRVLVVLLTIIIITVQIILQKKSIPVKYLAFLWLSTSYATVWHIGIYNRLYSQHIWFDVYLTYMPSIVYTGSLDRPLLLTHWPSM